MLAKVQRGKRKNLRHASYLLYVEGYARALPPPSIHTQYAQGVYVTFLDTHSTQVEIYSRCSASHVAANSIRVKELAMQTAAFNTDDISPTRDARQTVQAVSPIMHWWFLADTVLVFIAGMQLFVLSEFTDRFFAWTIKSTLTAAFLGAAYWSSIPMLVVSFRERVWANARVAVPGVWLFTVLTSIATFQHWDKFHWRNPLFSAQFAFWMWLGIYVLVPLGVAIAWFYQHRVPGGDPVRARPMQAWMRALLLAQAGVMVISGIALYAASALTLPLWAWALTPLTSAAAGAWCIGIGLTALWGIWENDWQRVRGAMLSYALLGVLQFVALARYTAQVDWSKPAVYVYVAFLLSILVVGALGVYFARQPRQDYV